MGSETANTVISEVRKALESWNTGRSRWGSQLKEAAVRVTHFAEIGALEWKPRPVEEKVQTNEFYNKRNKPKSQHRIRNSWSRLESSKGYFQKMTVESIIKELDREISRLHSRENPRKKIPRCRRADRGGCRQARTQHITGR